MKLSSALLTFAILSIASVSDATKLAPKKTKKPRMSARRLLACTVFMSLAGLNGAVANAEEFPFEVLSDDLKNDPKFMADWNSKNPTRHAYLEGLKGLEFHFSKKDYMGALPTDQEKEEKMKKKKAKPMVRRMRRKLENDDGTRYASESEQQEMLQAVLYSNIAFCQPEGVKDWTCGRCVIDQVLGATDTKYFHGTETDVVGYVTANPEQKQIIVSYRGSKSLANWLQNLKFSKTDTTWPDATENGAKVHSGFYQMFTETKDEILDEVQDLMAQYPDYSILFTGHSLGSALSTLALLGLMERVGDMTRIKGKLITVGSPRVGNQAFASYFQIKAGLHNVVLYRIVHMSDIVPHLPTASMEFRHVTREAWVEEKDKSPKMCSPVDGEDIRGSNSLEYPLNIGHHLEAFGVKLGGDDC